MAKYKYIILITLYSLSFNIQAIKQEEKQTIIYVKENQITNVFFEDEIQRVIKSNKTYQFNFNKNDKLILIYDVTTSTNGSLTIITKNKNIIHLKIIYTEKENLARTNYFINSKDIIANLAGEIITNQNEIIDTSKINEKVLIEKSNKIHEEIAENIINNKKSIKRYSVELYEVKIELKNTLYNSGKLYIHIKLNNNSQIDFDIDDISFYKRINETEQNIYIEPIYTNKKVTQINPKKTQDLVFAFDKFTLDKKKKLYIDIKEKDGDRDYILKIESFYINKPSIK